MNQACAPNAELFELLYDLAEDRLDAARSNRLETLLQSSAEMQQQYVDFMLLVGGLHRLRGEADASGRCPDASGQWSVASERRVESRELRVEESEGKWPESSDSRIPNPEIPVINLKIFKSQNLQTPALHSPLSTLHYWAFSYSVATVFLAVFLLGAWSYTITHPAVDSLAVKSSPDATPSREEVAKEPSQFIFVGHVSGMVDCQWSDDATATYPGAGVALNRRYALRSGLMEITYDSGATVILQGPCEYTIESTRGGYLQVGKLVARVESRESRVLSAKPQAANQKSEIRNQKSHSRLSTLDSRLFAVRTPTALVEDLGTEFGVEVGASGETTSHVFQGKVVVKVEGEWDRERGTGDKNSNPRTPNPEIVLSAGQSARVAPGNDAAITQIEQSAAASNFVRELPHSIVLTWFRLGEDDTGAVAGAPANRETREHQGRCRLEKRGGPRYAADAAPRGSTLAMSFSGAEGECFFTKSISCAVRDNFVIETWARVNKFDDQPQLIVHNGHSDRNGFGIIIKDGRWQGMFGGIGYTDSGVACQPGKWVHLAFVCQRGKTRMWVDGQPVGEPGRGWPVVPGGAFNLGGDHTNPSVGFNGDIDEVRVTAFAGSFRKEMLLCNSGAEKQGASSSEK
jgi:hypothetical protein